MSRPAQNLLIPFRRDKKRDFASGTAEELLASKVRQALLTEGATPRSSGELPWRTSFGAGLALLRHQRNDAALKELARVYVSDALKRWVPGAKLVSLRISLIAIAWHGRWRSTVSGDDDRSEATFRSIGKGYLIRWSVPC